MRSAAIQEVPFCKPVATQISSLPPCPSGTGVRLTPKHRTVGIQPMLKASKVARRTQLARFAAMAQSYTGPQSQAISRLARPCQKFALAAADEPGSQVWHASTWALCCRKLEDALHPSKMQVVNESHLHAGHMGNPDGAADAETHFRHVISLESNALKRFSLAVMSAKLCSLLAARRDVPLTMNSMSSIKATFVPCMKHDKC